MRGSCYAVLAAGLLFLVTGHAGSVTGHAATLPGRTNTVVVGPGQTISNTLAAQSAASGEVSGNTLLVDGGSLLRDGYGGESLSTGNAVGNAVIVRSGSVAGSVTGGLSLRGSASANTVIVSGGHVQGDITGGRAPRGDAVYNTVTLSGTPTFGPDTFVLGGVGGFKSDEFTGNTLNLLGFRGTVHSVGNFQTYTMVLPAGVASGDTILTLTGNAVPLANSSLRILSVGGNVPLRVGNVVTLFSQASGLPQSAKVTGVRQGLSRLYDFELAVDGPALNARVVRAPADDPQAPVENPQAPVVLKPQAAALALASQALELVAGFGMESAWRAAALDEEGSAEGGSLDATAAGQGLRGRWRPFAAMAGGELRYEAGARVRMQGGSAMAGLSRRWSGSAVGVMLGAFGEAGRGQYQSRETLSDGSTARAHGQVDFYGAGLLARLEAEHGALRGLHGEVSGRTGMVATDFRSGMLDLPDAYGGVQRAQFDTRAPYYSAHAGLGYRFVWGERQGTALDLYVRGFWTQVNGSSVTVLGEEVCFDATHSLRMQSGARFSHTLWDSVQWYVGAGWEEEFDGRVRGSVSGHPMPAASLQGSTALGEAGLTWRPGVGDWGVSLGVQGFAGKREGLLGRLEVSYSF